MWTEIMRLGTVFGELFWTW